MLLDGGAYASSTGAVVGNAGTLGLGPYRFPSVAVDALRGVHQQPAVRRDARVRLRAGRLRARGADGRARRHRRRRPGRDPAAATACARATSTSPARSSTPRRRSASCCRSCRDLPLPPERGADPRLCGRCPARVNNTTHGEGVVRGIGYAVTYKNVGFSEGFDDYSTARVRLEMTGGEAVATVHTAAAEVGQGLITVEQQICRTELGVERVVVAPEGHRRRLRRVDLGVPADLRDRGSGEGGLRGRAGRRPGRGRRSRSAATAAELRLDGEKIVGAVAARCSPAWPRCSGTTPSRRPSSGGTGPPTPIDPETGQGDAHVQFAFSAHRAVVDVDVELGLVKVVALDTAQDVGKAINPDAVVGQIHGGVGAGHGPGADGGDRGDRRARAEPVVHRLPDPDHPRHAADAGARCSSTPTRTRPTACAGWGSRRRSPPAGGRRRDAGRDRAGRCAGCRSARSTSPAPEPWG